MGKHNLGALTRRGQRKLLRNNYGTDNKGYNDLECVDLIEED
ncbi:MAG: hypothetical protein WCI04_06525 [archaeon]